MLHDVPAPIPVRSAVIRPHLGRPTIFLNDQPIYPLIYALTDTPGGRWSWEDIPFYNVQQFATHGDCRLYQLDIDFEHMWYPDGRFDITLARQQIGGVLAARPDAGVFLRLHVRPPRWWMKQHPEENTLYFDYEAKPDYAHGLHRAIEDDVIHYTPPRTSLASQRWLDEMGSMTRRFCRELAATPEGNALVGLHVAGAIHGEWQHWGIFHAADCGPAMTRYFRAWLAAKYKSDTALRAAWNDPAVTLASAAVPGVEPRHHSQDGIFRDPARERPVIDYFTAQHQSVGEAIIHFAKIAKESWPRPLVTGSYAGYVYSLFGRETTGGHLFSAQILRSPYVDYLSAPVSRYPDQFDAGKPYRSRGLLTSCHVHGKLWLDEMDSCIALPAYFEKHYSAGIQEGIAKTRRNVLHSYTKGMGLWFYDFGCAGVYNVKSRQRTETLCAGGWWDDPYVIRDIGKMHALLRQRAQKPYRSGADVLMVHDTDSFYYMNSHETGLTHSLVNWTTISIPKGGFVADAVYLADLPAVDLSQYRVVFFVNPFVMDAACRKFIREKVAANGRHLVWFYAPGYSDGRRNSVDFVSEVTGMTMKRVSLSGEARIQADPRIRPDYAYSASPETLSPLFAVADPQAQALGHFAGTEHVAIACKKAPTHTDWYVALPSWDTTLGMDILKLTAAHRYSDSGDIVDSGGGILMLHTAVGGKRSVTLLNGRRIEVDMPTGFGTVLLDSEDGTVLLPSVGKESLAPEGPDPDAGGACG